MGEWMIRRWHGRGSRMWNLAADLNGSVAVCDENGVVDDKSL